tara:strand:- start:294 stop:1226 length:933 start_codon:yes stop_codon:yes gene_type:complete
VKKNFSKITALVVGDLMLDAYVYDRKNRKSPEADVPIVLEENIKYFAGGAGNVIMNIKALGAKVIPIGVLGDDLHAERLITIFHNSEIKTDNIIQSKNLNTTIKKRIFIKNEQFVRLDKDIENIDDEIHKKIFINVQKNIEFCDIVILSDYEKGSLPEDLCKSIIELAIERKIPVIVDPKKNKIQCYNHSYAITPNLNEAIKLSGSKDINRIIAFFQRTINKNNIKYILFKNGREGITLITKNYIKKFEALNVKNPDVAGAGDTVISTFSLLVAAEYNIEDCVKLANIAAGKAVGKKHTSIVEIDEIFKD